MFPIQSSPCCPAQGAFYTFLLEKSALNPSTCSLLPPCARSGCCLLDNRGDRGHCLANSGNPATILAVSDVTRILEAAARGDQASAEELLPLVYQELRKLAAHKMAGQAPGQTLQATALVHEAWLRLSKNKPGKFAVRDHFLADAAKAMRHILIDSARR